jgi:peptidoglycan/LPS O-acetylase OafA/YrhL
VPVGFSTYLDLLRLAAALVVFLDHWGQPAFTGSGHAWFAPYGHLAVIVFFVLSGYLITAVAVERETSLRVFVASRAARIYSVALPALALTAAIDLILLAHGQGAQVPDYQYAAPAKYLALFLGFGTELWFVHEDAFSNVPYWSLSYEVWYYALFAAALYGQGRGRLLLIAGLALLVGPRLWLLLPVWALGSGVYRLHRRIALPPGPARWAFAGTLLAIVALKAAHLDDLMNAQASRVIGDWLGPAAMPLLRYSRYFLGDWLFAALLAANLFAARFAAPDLGAIGRAIRYFAGFTFTAYLMHYPLLELLAGLFAPSPALLAAGVLGAVWVLALGTERQKTRLRRLIVAALDRAWPSRTAGAVTAR